MRSDKFIFNRRWHLSMLKWLVTASLSNVRQLQPAIRLWLQLRPIHSMHRRLFKFETWKQTPQREHFLGKKKKTKNDSTKTRHKHLKCDVESKQTNRHDTTFVEHWHWFVFCRCARNHSHKRCQKHQRMNEWRIDYDFVSTFVFLSNSRQCAKSFPWQRENNEIVFLNENERLCEVRRFVRCTSLEMRAKCRPLVRSYTRITQFKRCVNPFQDILDVFCPFKWRRVCSEQLLFVFLVVGKWKSHVFTSSIVCQWFLKPNESFIAAVCPLQFGQNDTLILTQTKLNGRQTVSIEWEDWNGQRRNMQMDFTYAQQVLIHRLMDEAAISTSLIELPVEIIGNKSTHRK